MRPKVSVIVVSYNRSADLRLSLEAIFATGYEPLEVIVVDNASADDAADVAASFPAVKLVRNADNLGFAEGNDVGLALATGDYVALVNNDAVIEPRWIDELVDFLEAHPDAAAAAGKIYLWNDDNPLGARTNGYYAHSRVDPRTGFTDALMNVPDVVEEAATLSGACVMIRRRAIDDVGGAFLEPTFFAYYEETDFFARAIRRGWRLFYTGTPAAWHRVRASTAAQPWRYFFWMAKNRMLFAHRHLADADLAREMGAMRRRVRVDRVVARARPSDERRGRIEAMRWLDEHEGDLRRQRAEHDVGTPYAAKVDAIQARARRGAERPLVSIVVASHNYGRYLGEAIASALAQTYRPVEVVVVDDGSTDDSREVARRYPVTLVEQSNQGVSAARNHGAQVARGERLVFLDADDVLEPTYVERCSDALDAAPPHVAYAYTQMRYFGAAEGLHASRPFSRRRVLRGNLVNASAMLRRSAFEHVGGFSTAWRTAHEDCELWVRLLAHGFEGVLVPAPLLGYRRHAASRNTLSDAQIAALDWRLRVTYPRLYWPQIALHPLSAARALRAGR